MGQFNFNILKRPGVKVSVQISGRKDSYILYPNLFFMVEGIFLMNQIYVIKPQNGYVFFLVLLKPIKN